MKRSVLLVLLPMLAPEAFFLWDKEAKFLPFDNFIDSIVSKFSIFQRGDFSQWQLCILVNYYLELPLLIPSNLGWAACMYSITETAIPLILHKTILHTADLTMLVVFTILSYPQLHYLCRAYTSALWSSWAVLALWGGAMVHGGGGCCDRAETYWTRLYQDHFG